MELNIKKSDIERNFMKDRINNVEKHFSEISCKLASYVHKLAGLRDSSDQLAKSISNFASKENYNQTLRLSLAEFSDVLFSIQEYRDAQILRTHVKVIQELEAYTPLCKKTKVDVKKCFDSRLKELKKKNDLEKARSKTPSNWQKIAEKEVAQSHEEAVRMTQELGRLISWFEQKKLQDLKNSLIEFVKIEMIYHAKGIELLTKSFNILKEIKVEEDLHEFNSHFNAHLSSLDVRAMSSSNINTTPKVLESDSEIPDHLLHKPEAPKGIQSISRAMSSSNINTSPKVLESDSEIPDHLLHKPEAPKGIQSTSRSIFTLKSVAHPDGSGSRSGSFIDPTDSN